MSAAREQFVLLLRQLHTLFVAGQNDGDEADAIREQMEAPWYAMTEAERDEIRTLSKQLYAEAGP